MDPQTPKGDAFARHEVSSVYVSPKERFVVSLIVGVDAPTSEEAADIVLKLTRGTVTWFVHDRESGETKEIKYAVVTPATV